MMAAFLVLLMLAVAIAAVLHEYRTEHRLSRFLPPRTSTHHEPDA